MITTTGERERSRGREKNRYGWIDSQRRGIRIESEKTERGVKRRGSRIEKAGDGQTDTDRYTARG